MGVGGAGSGGSGSISGSTDAALSNPQQSQVLAYNASTSKWTNSAPSGGGNGYVRYVYYTGSSWPSRPAGIETVIWVGGTSASPPVEATETFDMWIHDAE